MSWSVGNEITASKLNTENGAKYAQVSKSGWQSAYVYYPNTTGYYCRNTSKQIYFYFANNVPGGFTTYVQRKEGTSWVTKTTYTNNGWGATGTKSYNYGTGWYRVYTSYNCSSCYWRWYWAKNNNAAGYKLRYYNSYTGSSYTTGSELTASLLNTGRVGTNN